MWTSDRIDELRDRFEAFSALENPKLHFAPGGAPVNHLRYFDHDDGHPLELGRYSLTMGDNVPRDVDIIILSAHGEDLGAHMLRMQEQAPGALQIAWYWDNHLGHVDNLRMALGCDAYCVSHKYVRNYLSNPVSVSLGHVPACCGQWSRQRLESLADRLTATPRSDALFAPYVNYGFSKRREFLQNLQREVPASSGRLMGTGDRSLYFSQSKDDQIREWMSYKTTVVVPVDRDLSTRFFDALACGLIPIVSDAVVDLDAVVPAELQQALPVLKYRHEDYASLRSAHAAALEQFAAKGEAGILARHRFAMTEHLLDVRLLAIAEGVDAIGRGEVIVRLDGKTAGLVAAATSA